MAEWAVNPLSMFLTVWGLATGLYVAGLFSGIFPDSTAGAVGAIALNIVAFSLGYLTWSMLCRLDVNSSERIESAGAPLTAARLRWSLRVTLLCGLVAAGLCAARTFAISDAYRMSLSQLVSNPTLWRKTLTNYIDQTVYETQFSTMAISLSSSLFSAGFVLLGIFLYFSRRWTRYFYALLFLVASLAVGFLNLGRKEVTVNILFVVLSYLFVHRLYRIRSRSEVMWDLVLPPMALAVLFVLIEVLLQKGNTYHQDSAVAGFLFSLYWYMASPLAAFTEFMRGQEHVRLMGQSLFFPFYKWLYRLHMVPEGTISMIAEKVYVPYGANVYSYLRNIYEDFGPIGVAVIPYTVGSLTAALRRRAELSVPFMNLYIILLVLIVFSFYNYLLVSSQYYLQVLVAFLVFRFRLTDLDKLSL
jgi:oligosaccharide repeat unit polymerase